MTNEAIALALDPERKRAEWWAILCEKGHATQRESKRIYPNYCHQCGCNYQDSECTTGDFCGPPLATDDLAAMQYVVPVLEEAGCIILTRKGLTAIYLDSLSDGYLLAYEPPKAPACAAAVAWLLEHDRERWDNAVREVGE